MNVERFRVPPGTNVRLRDYDTAATEPFGDKSQAQDKLAADVEKLADLQSKLHAQNVYGLLIILQGIDASGKDGTIKHVMSGVNPAGCQVKSFKVPSEEELDHDYLWRYVRALPERGNIGIFNRSYYEEVLVVRVHPELLGREHLQASRKEQQELWANRFEEINAFERYLERNNFEVLKFFLHLSKDEQKERFMARLDSPDKNWKFSEADVRERAFWDDYEKAFEEMLSYTSTEWAPWYVVPADRKWFSRVVVSDVIVSKLESLGLAYPTLDAAAQEALGRARKLLNDE
ncbi:MAG: polyphosphate kinase 2 family protein [Planctomycetota bacterium]|nr:MAG: polyphosphate kinase 2 family protein [Planctomycetota bacterium]